MKPDLASRLHDWKFKQATMYLDGESEKTQELVTALSTLFGDVGWALSPEMPLAIVITAALNNIVPV